MSAQWLRSRRPGLMVLPIMIGLSTELHSSPAQSTPCALPPQHAGVTFPVDQMGRHWPCQAAADHQQLHHSEQDRADPNPVAGNDLCLSPRSSAHGCCLGESPRSRPLSGCSANAGSVLGERRRGNGRRSSNRSIRIATTRIYYLEGSHNGTFLPRDDRQSRGVAQDAHP